VKAHVVSLSIPFIGPQRSLEARNIPSIGYEQTKVRKGSSPAWKFSCMEIFVYKNYPIWSIYKQEMHRRS